jgi:hypothetical protein
MSPQHRVKTADGVDLETLVEKSRRLISIYNEAERPFRDLFVEEVNQQTFYQEPPGAEIYWEELGEGEHPRTVDRELDDKQMFIRDKTFGRSIGYTQKFIEEHSEQRILRKIQDMLEGAEHVQRDMIMDALDAGIADGRQLWYDVPDYGENTFSDTHDHYHESTSDLFGSAGNRLPSEHLEEAKMEMTEHGFSGPFVALVSSDFKRKIRNQYTYNADFHIPMATGMRSSALEDLDIIIDGIRVVETPWITGKTFYLTQVQNNSPVKFYEPRAVQLTQGSEGGGPVNSPGDLLGANASARWGAKMVDPLRAVYVEADEVTTS